MVAGATGRAARLGVGDRANLRSRGDATALALPDASVDFAGRGSRSYSYVPQVERRLPRRRVCCARAAASRCSRRPDWDMCVYRSADPAQMQRIFDGRWRFAALASARANCTACFATRGLRLTQTEVFPIVRGRTTTPIRSESA